MALIKEFIECYKRIPYIIKHRNAFKKTEKKLMGYNKYSYMHDFDKLLMCIFIPFFGWENINKLHVKLSKHHFEYFGGIEKLNKIEMLIDWECAHLTKKNRCKNAIEYLEKYKSEYIFIFKNEIEKLFNKCQH